MPRGRNKIKILLNEPDFFYRKTSIFTIEIDKNAFAFWIYMEGPEELCHFPYSRNRYSWISQDPRTPARWDCKEEPRSKRTLRNLWNENEEEGTEEKGLFHTTVGASERTGQLSKEKSKHLFCIILRMH